MKRAFFFAAVALTLLGSTPASARRNRIYTPYTPQPPRTSPVPEPTAALVFGASLVVIGISKRRRSDR
jgi:hypothetical protein